MINAPHARHCRVETLRVEDRTRHELRVEVLGRRQVENADLTATLAQRGHDMATDKAAAARNEINRHDLAPARSRFETYAQTIRTGTTPQSRRRHTVGNCWSR